MVCFELHKKDSWKQCEKCEAERAEREAKGEPAPGRPAGGSARLARAYNPQAVDVRRARVRKRIEEPNRMDAGRQRHAQLNRHECAARRLDRDVLRGVEINADLQEAVGLSRADERER